MFSASIKSVDAQAAVYECEVKKNNGATSYSNIHFDRRLSGGGNDVGSANGSGIAYLSVGDTIEIWLQNKDNTADIMFEDITLSVIELK